MAKVRIPGGGGSADLDQVTVTGPEMLEGTAAIGPDGEIIEGEMPERGTHQEATSVNLWTDPSANKTNVYLRTRGGHYGGGSWPGDPLAEAEVYAEQSAVAQAIGLTAGKILANQTALGIAGTATSDATAGKSHILKGYSAYNNGSKVDGDVTVQSILSFNAAVYSSTAISFTWVNPAKGAYSGVIIVGKTGSYPTSITDGTRYYKGAGDNTAASGTSSALISTFASGVTYYFRVFSYAIKDGNEWIHATSHTATAATTKGQVVFTTSGSWTVPAGVRFIDIFCVGGGASGIAGDNTSSASGESGSGGGSGYTETKMKVAVTPGDVIPRIIGAGAPVNDNYSSSSNIAGSATSFGSYLTAAGGTTNFNGGSNHAKWFGRDGGSGSGKSGGTRSQGSVAGNGGSDGTDGTGSSNPGYNGVGQGSTTRAFGETGNTLYAGAGGGGAGGYYDPISENFIFYAAGTGGAGGGGNGGSSISNRAGASGVANTGGGGGGAIGYSTATGGAGGSGIIIVRWGY